MPNKVFLLILSFLIASFGGAALVIIVRGWWERRGERQRRRVAPPRQEAPPLALDLEPDFAERPGPIARFEGWFYRLVGESGLSVAPDVAKLFAVGCGLTLCGILLLWRDDLLAAAVGLVLGVLMVLSYYIYLRGKRRIAMQAQLPEVMDLLARAVRAGESLDQAMELVGTSSPAPLGPEFQRCHRQLAMGLSVGAAMRSLLRRAPLPELQILASTLVLQRRTGGSLPAMLERLSIVVRDRIQYHIQFRAATGASRVSTMMIALAGPLVAAYMVVFQRDYFARFLESPRGQMMLATAVALQVVGLVWTYLLLRSDY